MATGIVKFYNKDRGFGFIALDDGGNDVFVHISQIEKSGLTRLQEGDKVSFEVAKNERTGKSEAVNLQMAG